MSFTKFFNSYLIISYALHKLCIFVCIYTHFHIQILLGGLGLNNYTIVSKHGHLMENNQLETEKIYLP